MNYVESKVSLPYDIDKDPSGIYKWYEQSQKIQQMKPIELPIPNDHVELVALVKLLIESFNCL